MCMLVCCGSRGGVRQVDLGIKVVKPSCNWRKRTDLFQTHCRRLVAVRVEGCHVCQMGGACAVFTADSVLTFLLKVKSCIHIGRIIDQR